MTQIFYGAPEVLVEHLAQLGTKRVLVLASSLRHVDAVVRPLAKFEPAVFSGARVHVPAEIVDGAASILATCGADTIIAVGGGSPIGLGKALRLAHEVRFAAIPTTYAGSEMTTMFGITRGTDKQTGRDPRVRPDTVLYDVELTLGMPIVLSVQSLLNAIAHVVSVVSTKSLGESERDAGFAGIADVLAAVETLVVTPADREARVRAQRGASVCAAAFDAGKPGVQHAFAHLLGGASGVDHAPIHAVLLPQFIAHVRATEPAIIDEIENATKHVRLDAHLLALLARAGAPTSLTAIGIDAATVAAAVATRPELPASIVQAAL